MERQQLLTALDLPNVLHSKKKIHRVYMRAFHQALFDAINGTEEQYDLETNFTIFEARALQRELVQTLELTQPPAVAFEQSRFFFKSLTEQSVWNRMKTVFSILDKPAVSCSTVDVRKEPQVSVRYLDGSSGPSYTDSRMNNPMIDFDVIGRVEDWVDQRPQISDE